MRRLRLRKPSVAASAPPPKETLSFLQDFLLGAPPSHLWPCTLPREGQPGFCCPPPISLSSFAVHFLPASVVSTSNTVTSRPLHPPPVSPSSPPKHGDWYHSTCRPPPQTAGRKPPRSLPARCVTFSIFIYRTGLARMLSEGPVGLILEDSPYSCRDKPRDVCVCMYASLILNYLRTFTPLSSDARPSTL